MSTFPAGVDGKVDVRSRLRDVRRARREALMSAAMMAFGASEAYRIGINPDDGKGRFYRDFYQPRSNVLPHQGILQHGS